MCKLCSKETKIEIFVTDDIRSIKQVANQKTAFIVNINKQK